MPKTLNICARCIIYSALFHNFTSGFPQPTFEALSLFGVQKLVNSDAIPATPQAHEIFLKTRPNHCANKICGNHDS